MCINFASKSNTVKHQQANFSSANTKVEGSVQFQVIQVNARGVLGAPTVAEFQRNMFRRCFEKCKLLLECSAGQGGTFQQLIVLGRAVTPNLFNLVHQHQHVSLINKWSHLVDKLSAWEAVTVKGAAQHNIKTFSFQSTLTYEFVHLGPGRNHPPPNSVTGNVQTRVAYSSFLQTRGYLAAFAAQHNQAVNSCRAHSNRLQLWNGLRCWNGNKLQRTWLTWAPSNVISGTLCLSERSTMVVRALHLKIWVIFCHPPPEISEGHWPQ